MWGWKPAKQMLELLWNHGELVVAGRQGFQRLYDLPERAFCRARSSTRRRLPSPSACASSPLRAVRARGALTEAGIVEHWRLKGGTARMRAAVDALVADGSIERLAVEDGGPPVLVPAGAELDRPAPTAAVLLSPFDNLLWDRPFARRVLGFDHLIEVYKPAPRATLRLLRAAAPLGRPDRRAGRPQVGAGGGELVVRAFHRETGVRASAALDDAFDRALDRLRRLVGLESVRR